MKILLETTVVKEFHQWFKIITISFGTCGEKTCFRIRKILNEETSARVRAQVGHDIMVHGLRRYCKASGEKKEKRTSPRGGEGYFSRRARISVRNLSGVLVSTV